MPDDEKILISRYLRANDYSQTLASFLAEAGLPPDAGSTSTKGALTLEKLLQEKRAYDLAVDFEKLGTDEQGGWRLPAPETPTEVSLSSSSNILSLTVHHGDGKNEGSNPRLYSAGADRRVSVLDCGTLQTLPGISSQEAPILCVVPFSDYLIMGDMAGNVKLIANDTFSVLDHRKDHAKYVVKLAVFEQAEGTWIASAGWDAKALLYWVPKPTSPPKLGDPVAKMVLPTNPEAMVFVRNPDTDQLNLVLSRRDSTFLHFFAIPPATNPPDTGNPVELNLLGRQNLAPHALSWVTFTPSDIAVCPQDATKIAVATSSMPHMKVLIVRLLFPSSSEIQAPVAAPTDPTSPPRTAETSAQQHDGSLGAAGSGAAASAAHAQLAMQNREEAAIVISCNTMAPQTQYSTPMVVWRPDGSGCFVNGDDGLVRGIETASGKVVSRLRAHEPGSKVRCLWAGRIGVAEEGGIVRREEWLLSGGFDQRLVVWR